jgi:aldehyde:ferredoxin oxidoreductase
MAINPAGPDHTIAVHDTLLTTEEGVHTYAGLDVHTPMPSTELSPRKVAAMYHIGLARHFGNNLVMCNFVPHGIDGYREILNAATGWNMTIYEMLKSGERSLTLAHIFNLKNGLKEEDNSLPDRFHTSQRGGPLEGVIVDPQEFIESKQLIYEMLGWDPTSSIPSRSRLVELGIEWSAEENDEHLT